MVLVKICGIKDVDCAIHAIEHGADYVGVVMLAEGSPRNIGAEEAIPILDAVKGKAGSVVVSKSPPIPVLDKLSSATRLDAIQFHRGFTGESLAKVRKVFDGKLFFGIGPATTDSELTSIKDYLDDDDVILIDWSMGRGQLLELARFNPFLNRIEKILGITRERVFIAGGLNPWNVRDYIGRVRPGGVDVSSGVETSPGTKDPSLVSKFITSVKQM